MLTVKLLPWWFRWQRISPAVQETGFDPWVRKIPRRREWLPTPVFLPGKSHGQRWLTGHSPWGSKESDTSEQLTLHNINRHAQGYTTRKWQSWDQNTDLLVQSPLPCSLLYSTPEGLLFQWKGQVSGSGGGDFSIRERETEGGREREREGICICFL